MSAKVSAQQKILNSFENIEEGLKPIQAMKEVRKIESKQIMNLTLKENPEGYELMLDNKKLQYVEDYKIVKSSAHNGTAELTLEMLVKYP